MVKKPKTESQIQSEIMAALPTRGTVIFRNNTGVCRDGGRFVRYGLCNGSSDLIGWTPTVIAQEMVGETLAVFTAVEVKRPGKEMTEEQTTFCDRVTADGGYAGKADSVEAALEIIRRVKG